MISGRILITGGSGTLGHAIARIAAKESWDCDLTIYSRSELAQSRMRIHFPHLRYLLGDVRDYDRLEGAIAGHDIVIHAAALKRIPEAEFSPSECFQTNVKGSANVIRACQSTGVERCVLISTDKACRAVTAYGASKLMMEKYLQAQDDTPTIFTGVRYGNVVSSNGSVIPIWRDAVSRGEPVRITDIRCTRFWMTQDQAVELIELSLNQSPGTILVPKMPKLPIADMALLVAPGARLEEIGLRSCEKLHEDLVHTDELSFDLGGHFLIGLGQIGASYTSDQAPLLDSNMFLKWVAQAEEIEAQK